MTSRSRLRFSTLDDLELLRAVSARNPWEDHTRWTVILETVQESTGKPFTVRGIKEHLEHLLKLFSIGGIKKSGTEEEFDEKIQLLKHLIDLKQGFVIASNDSFGQKDSEFASRKRKSIEVHDDTCNKNVIYISTEEWPVIKEVECGLPVVVKQDALSMSPKISHSAAEQDSTTSTTDYFTPKTKAKAEDELQQRQLNLEERRLDMEWQRLQFDKEKFNFEKEERKTILELQRTERESYMKILQKQQEMLSLMIEQIVKKNE